MAPPVMTWLKNCNFKLFDLLEKRRGGGGGGSKVSAGLSGSSGFGKLNGWFGGLGVDGCLQLTLLP